MESLINIIQNKGAGSAILKGARAALTVEEANSIISGLFGSECVKYIEAVYLKNTTLGVRVKGTAAAAEVRMNQDKILAKIKHKFGPNSVTKIRFII